MEAGADLESRDKWRLSPLMYTVVCERSEMTQFLIEKGETTADSFEVRLAMSL